MYFLGGSAQSPLGLMSFPNVLDSERLKSRVDSYLSTRSIQPVFSDSEGATFTQTCSHISLVLDELYPGDLGAITANVGKENIF